MKIVSLGRQAQLEEFLELVGKENVIVILGISRTPQNAKGLLNLINAMAELERTSATEHQTGEMPKTRIGRPKKAEGKFASIYHQVKAGTKSASQGARELGIARSTWYRKVKDYEEDQVIDFG